MSEKRGIFSLEEFYDLQVSGQTTDIFDPYKYVKSVPPFGYFAGGYSGLSNYGVQSLIQRVDYTNDVISSVATLAIPGGYTNPQPSPYGGGFQIGAATGNTDFAYYCGGGSPATSEVLRYDYANDNVNATLRCLLTKNREVTAATGNLNFGYVAGTAYTDTTIDRIDYNNDTATATPKGNLASGQYTAYRIAAAGTVNYGYYSGGYDWVYNSYKSNISRIDYANDSVGASPKGNLGTAVGRHTAEGNADYGWHIGGTPSFRSTIQRIDYSNDTATAPSRGPLQTGLQMLAATGSSTHGFTSGGANGPSYQGLNSCYKIDHSNDTATANSTGYQFYNYYYNAVGSSPLMNGFPTISTLTLNGVDKSAEGIPSTFGYFAGGFLYDYSSRSSNNCRIDFSNDTSALGTKGTLSTNEHSECDGTSNSNHGYIIGGSMPSTLNGQPSYRTQSIISRIDFANDNVTATRVGNFFYNQYTVGIRATGNNDFGYFIGSNPSSNVSRIDYSNDNAGTIERGNITNTDVYQGAATGNLNFGYFVKYTRVERIDYSNDTAASTRKGDLSGAGSYYGAGVGNGNFGYFASGQPSSASTIISRLDYSNDTAQGLPKGNLAERRRQFAGTGNSNFGYYGGGTSSTSSLSSYIPTANTLSSTTRIDYANDTNTTSPKGNLTATSYGGTRGLSATSSSDDGKTAGVNFPRIRFIDNQEAVSTPPALYNFGYFSGGVGSTSINRIDFANDTGTIPERGSLSDAKRDHYAVGNQNFGYFAGGEDASSQYTTGVDRIDYANDNVTATPKGPLNSTFRMGNGTGNLNYGYLAGDFNGYPYGSSIVQRIDYANDTSTASNKGPLTYTAWGIGASGTVDYGFFTGGLQGNAPSPQNTFNRVNKMDYSNETVNNIANMNSYRARHGAVGNANYGYCIAGHPSFNNTERINYSNSTVTTTSINNNTGQFNDGGATGNNDYGYYGGGGYPQNVTTFPSTVRRVDYANDTSQPLSRCTFPDSSPAYSSNPKLYAKRAVSALVNGFPAITTQDGVAPYPSFNFPVQLQGPIPYPSAFGYGYAVAGPGASTVSRIDYSNDTATGVSKGPDDNNGAKASTSSETHGYLCGGYDPAPFSNTGITRTEYANDTAASTPKGNLASPAGLGMSGQGLHTPSYGWIWTTYPAGPLNRIDFANDTATAPNRQTTPATASRSGTTGNQTYAWKVGGSASGSSQTFTFRLEYANDTSAVSPKGNMDSPIDWPACFGNQNYAYFGGSPADENPNWARTSTHRIDYANDTATSVQKGSSPIAFGFGAGTSHNDNYGFMGMGDGDVSWDSRIYRVDYANDTVAASPSGPTSFGPVYANARSRMVSAADGGMTPGSPYS